MQSILGQISSEQTLFIHHRDEIIQIDIAMLRAVSLQPAIQFHDFLRRALRKQILRLRSVVVHWKDRRKNNVDAIGFRQFRHGSVVSLNILQRHRTGIAGNVIRSRQNHDNFGSESEDILAEAEQQLRLPRPRNPPHRLAVRQLGEFHRVDPPDAPLDVRDEVLLQPQRGGNRLLTEACRDTRLPQALKGAARPPASEQSAVSPLLLPLVSPYGGCRRYSRNHPIA